MNNLSCGDLNLVDQDRNNNKSPYDTKKSSKIYTYLFLDNERNGQFHEMDSSLDNFRKRYIPKVGE